ncbi:hypothetical protein QEN19_003727 [Hanseniaspora menglaensis]
MTTLPFPLCLDKLLKKYTTKTQLFEYLDSQLNLFHRELYDVPTAVREDLIDDSRKVSLKLMSYNMLAQSLAKSSMFPNAGKLTSWKYRNQYLVYELIIRDADIYCLQELDSQYLEDWINFFKNIMGFNCEFVKYGSKNHGCFIAYSLEKFEASPDFFSSISFDDEIVDTEDTNIYNGAKLTRTSNIGALMVLNYKARYLENIGYVSTHKKGVIIGTAHLFWHPFGTFERTRQNYILLKKMQLLKQRYVEKDYKSFFMGDFNAQPYLAPYEAMTLSKPVKFEDNKESFYYLNGSMEYDFQNEKNPFSKDPKETECFYIPENMDIAKSLEDCFNKLPMRAISMYGHSYSKVDSINSIVKNHMEPEVSNSCGGFTGLLDYIFMVVEESDLKVDINKKYQNLYDSHKVDIKKLLQVPTLKSLKSDNEIMMAHVSGSDHFSIFCEIDIYL